MIELILICLTLLLLGSTIWQRRNYVRVRRLSEAGWVAKHGPAGWWYHAPDQPTLARSLKDADRRLTLLKAHKELNVPLPSTGGYQLGDFSKDGDES